MQSLVKSLFIFVFFLARYSESEWLLVLHVITYRINFWLFNIKNPQIWSIYDEPIAKSQRHVMAQTIIASYLITSCNVSLKVLEKEISDCSASKNFYGTDSWLNVHFKGRPFNFEGGGGWVISGQQEFFFLTAWWAAYFFPSKCSAGYFFPSSFLCRIFFPVYL